MDALKPEAKREIVRLVFPDLRYGGDPDIERYFELRKSGQLTQALALYNGALRIRYPDDSVRVLLLKMYREHDPRYHAYQDSLMMDFAGRLAGRIAANIDIITAPLERADLSDALHALKAVESILTRLPGDIDRAVALLSKYEAFARIIDHRAELTKRALDLLREYEAVSRADSSDEYDFVARSAALEERRRASSSYAPYGASGQTERSYDFVAMSAEHEERRRDSEKRGASYFDPSRIKFTDEERASVEISPKIERREDKVLAFCAKYWGLVRDQSFERIVFLYSRKYGTKHFEIFRAIKLGRTRGFTDDEILSAVSTILTTSYSYSVSGDLYMQIMWRRLRARMEARAMAEKLAEPGPESKLRSKKTSEEQPRDAHGARALQHQTAATPAREEATKEEKPIERPAAGVSRPTLPKAGEERAPEASISQGASEPKQPQPEPEPARPEQAASAPRPELEPMTRSRVLEMVDTSAEPRSRAAFAAAPTPEEEAEEPTTRQATRPSAKTQPAKAAAMAAASSPDRRRTNEVALRPASKPRGARLLGRAPSGPDPVGEIRAKGGGSVSDSIKKLSGKGYDVYKEIFLEKVRDSIHKYLLAHQTKSHGLFDSAANEAEDQVYAFFVAHYDDPFMDWSRSVEREAVEALGFTLPNLMPIIESCFSKLQR